MTAFVILDADFLSAFLKIKRSTLIPHLYQVEQVYLTPAVYQELAQTSLLPQLTALSWLTLAAPPAETLATLRQNENFSRLGAGEQEAIALAWRRDEAILLSNDNRARQLAVQLGVSVVNIPTFLLACKLAGELAVPDLRQIIDDLWHYDYYRFRQEVQDQLLA